MQIIPLHFFTAVWGASYVENFLRVVLPTLLSPGNFEASLACPGDRYTIHAPPADANVIRSSKVFARLKQFINAEVVEQECLDFSSSQQLSYDIAWQHVNRLYRESIKTSINSGSALVMLEPDMLWADGGLKAMRSILSTGKRVVILSCVTTAPEKVIRPITERFYNPETCTAKMSSREFVALVVPSFHEYGLVHYWDADFHLNSAPGMFYFRVNDKGVVLLTSASNPQAILHRDSDPEWPIAGGFELIEHMTKIDPEWKSFHVVVDSDEIVTAGVESARYGKAGYKNDAEELYQQASIMRIACWMKEHLKPANKRLLDMPVLYHASDIDQDWMETLNYANRIKESICNCMVFFDAFPEVYEDLKVQFKLIDGLREQNRNWGTVAGCILSGAALSPSQQFLINGHFARSAALSNQIDEASRFLEGAFRCDPAQASELCLYIGRILELSGRSSNAYDLLVKHSRLFESK